MRADKKIKNIIPNIFVLKIGFSKRMIIDIEMLAKIGVFIEDHKRKSILFLTIQIAIKELTPTKAEAKATPLNPNFMAKIG